MRAVAELLGVMHPKTVRTWVRQAQIDAGNRPGVTSDESPELKWLRQEDSELECANAILILRGHTTRRDGGRPLR